MKNAISKQLKKIISSMLIIVFFVSMMGIEVFAAESTNISDKDVMELKAEVVGIDNDSEISIMSTDFVDASITVSRTSQGMRIVCTTIVNRTASIVGVKDIMVYHKEGSKWVPVATSDGGSLSDTMGVSITAYYPNAIYGDTYKISCVHYANVDEYRELPSETIDFKYILPLTDE